MFWLVEKGIIQHNTFFVHLPMMLFKMIKKNREVQTKQWYYFFVGWKEREEPKAKMHEMLPPDGMNNKRRITRLFSLTKKGRNKENRVEEKKMVTYVQGYSVGSQENVSDLPTSLTNSYLT